MIQRAACQECADTVTAWSFVWADVAPGTAVLLLGCRKEGLIRRIVSSTFSSLCGRQSLFGSGKFLFHLLIEPLLELFL